MDWINIAAMVWVIAQGVGLVFAIIVLIWFFSQEKRRW